MRHRSHFKSLLAAMLLVLMATDILVADGHSSEKDTIELRAWGVPADATNVNNIALLRILEAFQKKFPNIKPVSTTGLVLPGSSRSMNIVPLMQIAGDIAPHVMYVNFRISDTYIRNKFLYPLDKYIESSLGLDVKDGHLLELDEYLAELKKSPRYKEEIEDRVPYQCWAVMRRECPYGEDCPYCKKWGGTPAKKHYHVWAFPQGALVKALFYRRDLFRDAGLPDRVPDTMEEFLDWARKLTDPEEDKYGVLIGTGEGIASGTQNFLYSMGGRLVKSDENGDWRCAFDSPEAIDTYYFVARLFHEPFVNPKGQRLTSVVYPGETAGGTAKIAMFFGYLDDRFFSRYDYTQFGFGPVPAGPAGKRGSEFNSYMTGIYAGLENDKAARDAAWEYIRFYDGTEARKIRARVYIENGQAKYLQPKLLEAAGFNEYVKQIPKEWIRAYEDALTTGVPEPYGKNCLMIYTYASKGIDQVRTDPGIKQAIESGNAAQAKSLIGEILSNRAKSTNEKMLKILPPEKRKVRNLVASIVTVAILIIFVLVFRKVFRVFSDSQVRDVNSPKGKWQFRKYRWAYIILIPAVSSIILWTYYPLARGSLMAFQNYNVRGFSEWVGMGNFADVIFDAEFWYAIYVSFKYTVLVVLFGFTAPIILAFLLTEVPQGKILFRTIYYLPAVLSGVIVIFLWKSFYGQYGAVNEMLNMFIGMLNTIPGVAIAEVHKAWLSEPSFALLFVLLPVIWAGVGPGCLIYLAAMKTIPEEIYEAADIDGAGIMAKVFHIAIPSIKSLIMINFIGVVVGAVKGGSNVVLAMTGGGPYSPYGQTEVIGLHIYWEAFGYLRFGTATAMAWVIGSMLVGFTVLQLQRLSKMEFRAAGGVK